MSKVRVRFAPSPTGFVHVGNARTALFNWLFARHSGGAMVLRIEDTDVERSEARFETQLIEDMRWLGLDWDEGPDKGGEFGPYRQSERLETYKRYATELIDAAHAYFCFCTAEELEADRQAALKEGRQPRYSGRCRTRPREEAARKVAEGTPAAIRLKILEGNFTWHDVVHGPTSFSSEVIGDPILVRSDGHPAYNYAVVIDDHLMNITHVIRGDDHISNTPRQLAVYGALGWQAPEFAHLSTILGADRTRLSKRHGATSLENFREMGILPEALRNYLALLGWSAADGVTEILSDQELTAQFSLERITKSPAVFDIAKLYSLNRHYIKQRFDVDANVVVDASKLDDNAMARASGLTVDQVRKVRLLAEETVKSPAAEIAVLAWLNFEKRGYLFEATADSATLQWFLKLLQLLAPSVDRLNQLLERASLIFEYDAAQILSGDETRHVAEDASAREVLKVFIPRVLAENELTYERFRAIAKEVQKETGKKGKDLFHPIRVAVTGAVSGPELEKLIPIFEEGSKLKLARHVKSTAERLREFAEAAKL
jgi:nondiscriminating glutamyl-tRNA synthetase